MYIVDMYAHSKQNDAVTWMMILEQPRRQVCDARRPGRGGGVARGVGQYRVRVRHPRDVPDCVVGRVVKGVKGAV